MRAILRRVASRTAEGRPSGHPSGARVLRPGKRATAVGGLSTSAQRHVREVDDERRLGAVPTPRDDDAGYSKIPDDEVLLNPDVSDAEVRVYGVLVRYARFDPADGGVWASQETIGRAIGKERKTVQRILAQLARRGLITCVRRGRTTNLYRVTKLKARSEASNLRQLRPSMPQIRDVDAANMGRRDVPYLGHDTEDLKHKKQQQGTREAPDDVVSEIQVELRAKGVRLASSVVVHRLDIARRWVEVAEVVTSALMADGIRRGYPPSAGAIAAHKRVVEARVAEAARDRESRANADRETAEQREAAEAATLLAGLPPRLRAAVDREAVDQLARLAHPTLRARGYVPSADKLAERAATVVREISVAASAASWLRVVEHEPFAHVGAAPPPDFAPTCPGCCDVRDYLVDRRIIRAEADTRGVA